MGGNDQALERVGHGGGAAEGVEPRGERREESLQARLGAEGGQGSGG